MMNFEAVKSNLSKLIGLSKPPDDMKCYRNLNRYKVYCRTYPRSCFGNKPSEYCLWDDRDKVLYRIYLKDFKSINEFIQVLQGTAIPIEAKELLLLARKIRDTYRKEREKLKESPELEAVRQFLYQTCWGRLEGLEMLAKQTKNMDIAAEIEKIGHQL